MSIPSSAFDTLAAAITAADTDVGTHNNWARRNTIYAIGDGTAEVLTVVPEKTDIVGLGSDAGAHFKLIGTFTVATGTTGTRFFNVGFIPTTAAPAFTVPTASSGWEFQNCTFYFSANATHGLYAAADVARMKIINYRAKRI